MKELASEGMTAEVVEEITTLDPDFFTQNPTLLFQLKHFEFFKLIHAGDHSSALKVASSHLGPLAAKHPALLKPLKETTLSLLQSTEEPSGKHFPLDALATLLQIMSLLPKLPHQPQLLQTVCLIIGAYSKWPDAAPSGIQFLEPLIGILVSGMRVSEDTTAAAALAFRHICDDYKKKLCDSLESLYEIYKWAMIGGPFKVSDEDSLNLVEALSVRVSNELGMGHPRAARYSEYTTLFQSLLIGILYMIVVLATRNQLSLIFSNSEVMQRAVAQLSPLLVQVNRI